MRSSAPLRAPAPLPARRPPLPVGPKARRFARALVRELRPLVPRSRDARGGRRLLALFVDGMSRRVLASGADGAMRFLPALRDAPGMREARTFSGIPSSTASFQAGLLYGAAAPDIPAFGWLDRATLAEVHLHRPHDAAAVEARVARGSSGLLEGGSAFLTILRGGARNHLGTAASAEVLDRPAAAIPPLRFLPAMADVHRLTAFAVLARGATELPPAVLEALRFSRRTGTRRHEGAFLAKQALLGILAREAAIGQAAIDLVRGVPRILVSLVEYDEACHRRGPDGAREAARRVDRAAELLAAIAEECPDPPDVWVFTDHGQLAATPFEALHGCTLAEWLRGAADGVGPPPEVPEAVRRALAEPAPSGEPLSVPRTVDAGNYAHVYLARGTPLRGRALLERFGPVLARALRCPGVGLVLARSARGPLALGAAGPVDPADRRSIPRGASPAGVAAALSELARSPSAGDLVLYGAWRPGSCVAFSWEHSSHGGPSPEETETFVLHPAHVPHDVGRVAHGADLHSILRELYGAPGSDA